MAFPIDRASYRTLDPGWEGQVIVADIDRTYLSTRFSSLKGMARIPFERAIEKRDIEGMARLLRELRRGPGREGRDTPLYFVSASPSQLRPVIERKMAIDGIVFDGTTFKDWAGCVRRGRLSRLREQIGFKLTALMTGRANLPEGAQEILIGDDLETDPVTYAIYADSLSGRIPTADLPRILRLNGVYDGDAQSIARLRRSLRPGRGVKRALIRLERFTDADELLDFGPGIIGCRGAFQMAVAAWKIGALSLSSVGRVAADLAGRGVTPSTLADRLRDLYRRAMISFEEVSQIIDRLRHHGVCDEVDVLPDVDPRWREAWGHPSHRVWTPPQYVGE